MLQSASFNKSFKVQSFGLTRRSFATEVKFGREARELIFDGIDGVANAVSVTLGPKGRNVAIQQSFGGPKITKDGVTVAKAINFENKFANVGAQLIKDVAGKTNEVAGDGTTTATILTREIFREGSKAVAAGMNPMDLKRGIDLATKVLVAEVQKNSRLVSGTDQITQVATISANGEQSIGALIASAMEEVGQFGVISVESGQTLNDELVLEQGMQFDRGFLSPFFMTDAKKQVCEYENAAILVVNDKIDTLDSILPILEQCHQQRTPLVIIADDFDSSALSSLVYARLRQQPPLRIAAVKAPGFGDNKTNNLEDIAILTGGTMISKELGHKLEEVTQDMLGSCSKISISQDSTEIREGAGKQEDVDARCDLIKIGIENSDSNYDIERLQKRLAKLTGGVAVLKLGGASEIEVQEKQDRVEDALNATRAAVDEGIVPGGGMALLYSSQILKSEEEKCENPDQAVGIRIVRHAVQGPARQICSNAGLEGGLYIKELLKKADGVTNFTEGIDASNDTFVDMFEAGIIDPCKVTVTALTDASSVSSLLTTTEALICEMEDPAPPAAMGAGGMGGMGGGMGF